jgi:diacylglycerol kinase
MPGYVPPGSDAEQPPATRAERWRRKFAGAARGWRLAAGEGSSYAVHLPAAALALIAGWRLEVSPTSLAALALAVGLVLTAEMLNSAVERLARVVTDQYDERVRDALDVASGAVLAAAACAVVVGLAVLGPPLWRLW